MHPILLVAVVLLLVPTSGCQYAQAALPTTQGISSDPMGGTPRPFDCNSDQYVVQVASHVTEQDFIERVDQVRRAGQLPANTHYVTQDDDCNLISTDAFWLLYSGPYPSAAAACPALLMSPPDAFIKGLRQETHLANSPCLCSITVDQMPMIREIDQEGQWISEVQRSLLDVGYSIDVEINTNPGRFSEGTSRTVKKFQKVVGLSPTGYVDRATWERLKVVICGQA